MHGSLEHIRADFVYSAKLHQDGLLFGCFRLQMLMYVTHHVLLAAEVEVLIKL